MINQKIGFAFTGSFCTYEKALEALERVCEKYETVIPIMSENSSYIDSRFGSAESFAKRIETLCGRKVINSIAGVEPIGPKALLDILVIAPCTGNTIAKIASGITDTSVTMAAKAQLRNSRPVLIAIATNDGLSGNAPNIGMLLNRKNMYFVPFYQDDPLGKPCSLAADFDILPEAIEASLEGRQYQPVITSKLS